MSVSLSSRVADSMRLGKKNSTNLEQLDYLQDLNRLLFSNVVDQAEYYLAYYMGGGDKKASSGCKITGIHKSSSAPGRFLDAFWTLSATGVHRHVSNGFNDTNEMEGIFTRAL
jgi:hypothetical protein